MTRYRHCLCLIQVSGVVEGARLQQTLTSDELAAGVGFERTTFGLLAGGAVRFNRIPFRHYEEPRLPWSQP